MATLIEYRVERGWTQKECAKELGIGLRTVRRCEQGRRIRPYTATKITSLTHGAVTFGPAQKEAAE